MNGIGPLAHSSGSPEAIMTGSGKFSYKFFLLSFFFNKYKLLCQLNASTALDVCEFYKAVCFLQSIMLPLCKNNTGVEGVG